MPKQNIIAVIFDFDDTLAPDSTSSFLESIGVDVLSFWQERVNQLKDAGWDPVPAYLFRMIEESKQRAVDEQITKQRMIEFGKSIKLYPGAQKIFPALKAYMQEQHPEVEVEFYLVSSGIGEILRSTPIAKHFQDIWACDFHYGESGGIEFPCRLVSFTDKTRFIFHVAKGIFGEEYQNKPFEVNRKVSDDALRVPLDQMIFVGDGMTDIPCFSLVRRRGGEALGIYDPDNQDQWGRAWGFVEQNRVSNLVPADYRKNSALNHSLQMALSAIATRVELRTRTYQG